LRDEGAKLRVDQSTKLDALAERLQALQQELRWRPPTAMKRTPSVPFTRTSTGSTALPSDTGNLLDDSVLPLSTLHGPSLTENDIKQLEDGISTLLLTQKDLALMAKEQAFLRSLNFASRTNRFEDIPIAHKDTFQWIIDPSLPSSPLSTSSQVDDVEAQRRHSLCRWLRHENGIFWISGKAGCGKSTLMKMIAGHDTTRQLLEQWASPKKSVIAAHYFWTAGSAMQNSQQGLIQTLLYDIFRMSPEQIPELMPTRWAKLEQQSTTETADAGGEWTMPELLHTLQQLSSSRSLSARYCIIIDGIDEFDGDHFEMCEFLKSLSSSPNFKFCVSSRPWNVFEDAFGGNPSSRKVCVHDLTRRDILAFAQSRMAEHPRWKEPYFSAAQMDGIIQNITERARGVFLWVFLVTRSLRDGLVNGDTMLDLQKRLESLPTDLEAFFRHMMDTIDPIYHERMARVLSIAVNAKESLSLQFYYMHEFEEEDVDYALHKPVEWYFVDQIEDSLEQCRRRINARCGGLLEVKDHRVEFLHRTVRDFLLTRDMSEYLRQKSSSDFRVSLSTLRAFIFLFRFWSHSNEETRLTAEFPRWNWNQAMAYANDAIKESKEASFALLDAVNDHYMSFPFPNDRTALGVETHHAFLSSLLIAGVEEYVCARLDDDVWLFGNLEGSPICEIIDRARWDAHHANIITSLLASDLDCDINQDYDPYKLYDFQSSDDEIKEEEDPLLLAGGGQVLGDDGGGNPDEAASGIGKERVDMLGSYDGIDSEDDDTDAGSLSPWHRLLHRVYHDRDDVSLRTAVENSLFSIFLQHGARKEARLKESGWLPCTHVVVGMIRNRESYKFGRQCVTVLDQFLLGDASDVRLQLDEILGVIPDELCDLANQPREQRRSQFVAEVLQRLICNGVKVGVSMESLVSQIERSFPGVTGSILVDLIRHRKESAYFYSRSGVRGRKRKAIASKFRPNKRAHLG